MAEPECWIWGMTVRGLGAPAMTANNIGGWSSIPATCVEGEDGRKRRNKAEFQI